MIDVNVHLSRWPCRRLPLDEQAALVARLKQAGITEAWAGSFDALLHRDIAAVNDRTAAECRQFGGGLLKPVGTLNPTLPEWRADLARCVDEHKMHAVRIYPNYHRYGLDEPVFVEVLDAVNKSGLILQIATRLEDERTHHPLLKVLPVDLKPLQRLISGRPKLRVVVLNALSSLRNEPLTQLANAGQVWFDLAMLEGVGGIETVLESLPPERLLFGTHAPFFAVESAVLKLQESELPMKTRQAITLGNAQKLSPR